MTMALPFRQKAMVKIPHTGDNDSQCVRIITLCHKSKQNIWVQFGTPESNTSHVWPIHESNPFELLVFKATQVESMSQVKKSGEQVGSTIWVHESGSNTSHTWSIHESNPEQLLVFKAPRVGSTSRVNESGEQVGSTIWVNESGP